MIKSRLCAFGVLMALAGPAAAQGVGITVYDPTTFAKEVEAVVTAGQQLTNMQQQLQQALSNGQALTNLQTLMNAYGLSPSQLNQTQLTNLLKTVYTLSSDDPNFSTNLTNTLSAQGYTVPQSQTAVQSQSAGVYDPNYAAKYNANYNQNSLGYQNYQSGAKLMSDVQSRVATNEQNLNNTQIPTVATLTDNSAGASLHTLAAGQVLQSQQQDAQTRLAIIQADALLQQQLDKVQQTTNTSNEQIGIDQSRQKALSVTTPSTNTNPITQ